MDVSYLYQSVDFELIIKVIQVDLIESYEPFKAESLLWQVEERGWGLVRETWNRRRIQHTLVTFKDGGGHMQGPETLL